MRNFNQKIKILKMLNFLYDTETFTMSYDIANMFLIIDNVKEMDAVRLALNRRDSNKQSTECGTAHLYV